MKLEGSCHCGSVTFTVQSEHPYPFNLCYCSICRKTAGSGGYAINLGGDYETLEVDGKEHISVYQALMTDPETGEKQESSGQRHFCKHCGSALWLWDPTWPELVHPLASAIDTALPKPPERTHMMLASKAPWVEVCNGPKDKLFEGYPDESLAQWHQRLGVGDAPKI
ncbi:GFA family protein [Marinimicrobium locisalis]|uniref:GFA family protein n=1 Tax=Marinimicrobium locisalis TaxID=546022 RepID=UPI0032218224